MDVPGHPRVRGGFQAHLAAARGVVFVLDSVDFLPHKTETAECARGLRDSVRVRSRVRVRVMDRAGLG